MAFSRSMLRLLFVALAAAYLANCTQTAVATKCYVGGSVSQCYDRPSFDKITTNDLARLYDTEPWFSAEKPSPPTIGLALMGGGSQAGAFALGVVKRLVDDNAIQQVDIVSSVSGGGYAALYLYSHAAYVERDGGFTRPDAIETQLKPLFAHHFALCSGVTGYPVYTYDYAKTSRVLGSRCPQWVDEFCLNPKLHLGRSAAASMHFARCNQDMLASDYTKFSRTKQPADYQKLISDGVVTGILAPIYWLSNIAFDTRLETSPTKSTYRNGIYRGFGYVPDCWIKYAQGLPNACQESDWVMQSQNYYSQESKALTYETLAKLSSRSDKNAHLPMWILNATIPTRPFWDPRRIDTRRMDDFRFEFTPFGFGNRQYGFVKSSPDNLGVDVTTALIASAGFLDPAQRVMTPAVNWTAELGMNIANIDWSTSLPNYRLPTTSQLAISAIPAPLHALTRFNEPNMRAKIHLGDGGISRDTFGILALIERGTRHIFVSDHVDDQAGEKTEYKMEVGMRTLCTLADLLDSRGYDLIFFGHPEKLPQTPGAMPEQTTNIAAHCKPDGMLRPVGQNGAALLDAWHWKRPIWSGIISRKKPDATDLVDGIQIHLVKTAIDLEAVPQPMINACLDTPSDSVKCPAFVVDTNPALGSRPQFPPYLAAWWMDGGTGPTKGRFNDGNFPQDSMAVMTVDNSQSLFTAYLELGNYLAFDMAKKIKELSTLP